VFAASEGHLDVLQWAHANGCLLDERTHASAAKGGHLDVLEWARAQIEEDKEEKKRAASTRQQSRQVTSC
jgi:hypothetical protein